MAEQMIVEYIRKGYKGKRIVKDGIEYVQHHRGPRIGVFVALSLTQFGWSLVHLRGEGHEPAKNVSWKKGVEMAIARAKGEAKALGITENVPDSIRKQFESFKKRSSMVFTEKVIPVEGKNSISALVANDGTSNRFGINFGKKARIRFDETTFKNLISAMEKAVKEGLPSV